MTQQLDLIHNRSKLSEGCTEPRELLELAAEILHRAANCGEDRIGVIKSDAREARNLIQEYLREGRP